MLFHEILDTKIHFNKIHFFAIKNNLVKTKIPESQYRIEYYPEWLFFRPFTLAKQGRITEYLQKIHEYMMTLHYNHTGTQFFETKPNR